MSNTANSVDSSPVSTEPNADQGLWHRVFCVMLTTTVLALVVAALFAPWRVATGLLLGGLLSLLNHHWLQSSVSSVVSLALGGVKPQLRIAQFILRYLVVGAAVFVAYQLRVVSLPAVLVGLSTFVVALFFEALREIYFVMIQREEIN